ncbi:MAG: hypothetical protein CSA81_08140 [Acidobacteria bacterium]|nr:MAG: hypothetical protein CSA81_08140 [Acidobacteriota bacterium]PIE89694.1 MAG: hypothetical protein CR997_09675 [Acidobacteriota bacterium]
MMKYLSFVLSESLTNLWRSRVLSMLSMGTIGFSMYTLAMFLFLGQNLKKVSISWESHIQFQIFLLDDLTTEQRLAIHDFLDAELTVEKVTFLSKEEARKRFSLSFEVYDDVNKKLSANPFPASFSVHLLPGTSEDVLLALFSQLEEMEGIEEISYNRDIYEKLGFFANLFNLAGWFFGGIMIFASIFTVSNVLKLTFFSRKEEVDIMKLVGASHATIRGPFIFEGLFQGLLGTILGLFFGYLSVLILRHYLNQHPEIFLSHLSLEYLGPMWIFCMLLAGCVAGMLGSLFSLKEFLHEHISYE